MVGGWRLSVPNGHGRYMSMQRRHASVDILTKWVPRDKTFLFSLFILSESKKPHNIQSPEWSSSSSAMLYGAAAAEHGCNNPATASGNVT